MGSGMGLRIGLGASAREKALVCLAPWDGNDNEITGLDERK